MSRRVVPALALLAVFVGACRPAEPTEAVHARAKKAVYEKQVRGLEETLARFRREPPSKRRLLVAIDEQVFGDVVGAMLPLQVPVKDRLTLRLEKAQAWFRYTQGVILFEGRLAGVRRPDLYLSMRLAGGIDRVALQDGRLSAHVKLYYFEALGSGLGEMGRSVVEQLVRDNLSLIGESVPPIVIPVSVEQGIAIPGLGEGPVSVEPGTLPLSAAVANTLSFEGRLWIAIEIEAGPWQPAGKGAPRGQPAEAAKAPAAALASPSPSRPARPPGGPRP